MLRPVPFALLLLLAGPAGAATVLSVGDGDTLRVVDGSKRLTIRMACIDAPETAQRPYGAASRQRLQELAPVGSVVTLRPQTIDKYGRTVAEVFRGGQNTNLAMVSSGQAFAYRKYLGACDGSAYLGAEAAAQRQRVGVWAVPGGIQRPWDWRKGTRPPAASNRAPAASTAAPFLPAAGSAPPASAPAGGYSGRKLTCRQIGSYARAQELLRQGHSYLDKNGDGVACESLR
jgi:endonuclease YncB( thermonuclease family)